MDKDTAKKYLTSPHGKKPSEIGEAVDVLYQEYGSYEEMARHLRMGKGTLSQKRHIFQLPKGIRWKVDEGHIELQNGYQISRLKNEDDQWLLAFVVVEERLDVEVCTNVVNRVLRHNDSIRTALSAAAGVRCDRIDSLLLPLGFDIRFAISQKAWNQGKEWKDVCYDKILASELQALVSQLDDIVSLLRDY